MIWENSDAAECRIQDSVGFLYIEPSQLYVKLHPSVMLNHLSVLVHKQKKTEQPPSDTYLILNSQQIHGVL